MTVKENELMSIKDKIADAKSNHAEAEGAYKQVMKDIDDEFDCSDLDETDKEIKKMTSEIDEADDELDNKMDEFRKEYDL